MAPRKDQEKCTALTFELKNPNETVLLHKRPYEYMIKREERKPSNETAYFQSYNQQMDMCFERKSDVQTSVLNR